MNYSVTNSLFLRQTSLNSKFSAQAVYFMVEMHCWEPYLVLDWNKYRTSTSAGWEICTDNSPGWERTKVTPGNLLIREVSLDDGNSYVFHSKFRNLIYKLPW